jgi:hypothetical protein
MGGLQISVQQLSVTQSLLAIVAHHWSLVQAGLHGSTVSQTLLPEQDML